jgi:AbrB family looped-hinge helix DNA binding protein
MASSAAIPLDVHLAGGYLPAMSLAPVKMDASGRIVIPRDLREALGLPDGGELRLSVQDGELRATTRLTVLRRIQAEAQALGETALSDELTELRRAEALCGLNEDQARFGG